MLTAAGEACLQSDIQIWNGVRGGLYLMRWLKCLMRRLKLKAKACGKTLFNMLMLGAKKGLPSRISRGATHSPRSTFTFRAHRGPRERDTFTCHTSPLFSFGKLQTFCRGWRHGCAARLFARLLSGEACTVHEENRAASFSSRVPTRVAASCESKWVARALVSYASHSRPGHSGVRERLVASNAHPYAAAVCSQRRPH